MSVAEITPPAAGPSPGRQPPQDVGAEQGVLGGMLLSKDAIADVVEELRPGDFYRPAHQTVYETILDLYGRGEPADPLTVAAELTRAGQIARVGGQPYLYSLVHSVPTPANAGYYARIVREQAVLRRLIEAGTRIVQLGYNAAGQGGDVADVVDLAQAAVYDVTEQRTGETYLPLRELVMPTLEELENIASHGGSPVGAVPTGFRDLDALTNGLHPGQMVILAARPSIGKSTLGLDFARSAAIHHGLAAVLFSLEMGRTEITMRLLSAEAKVPLKRMRSGTLADDDWARLVQRMGEIDSAPLFIDDSPDLTMMEIRAKGRRLRQRHDLKLIVVDYMQLMTSPRRVENRQQEVADLSRSLKLLAKELQIPVVAISQLNRNPETRQDKRPLLSDLRECLAGDTLIWRSDTGARVPIRSLVGQRDIPVWSVDRYRRLRPAVMTEVWSTGRKPVAGVRLRSGRRIVATANHPLLTASGWRRVGELVVGDPLAVTRRVPRPDQAAALAAGPGGGDLDVVPPQVRRRVRGRLWSRRPTRQLVGTVRGSVGCHEGLSGSRTVSAAEPRLTEAGRPDVEWDPVTAVEPAGEEEVFDACVPGTHSFVANDVVSHNSGAIEMDADLVILLHREDAYDRESARAGEADLIVAKHRNGPTDVITVAFQGHFSRFVDMQRG